MTFMVLRAWLSAIFILSRSLLIGCCCSEGRTWNWIFWFVCELFVLKIFVVTIAVAYLGWRCCVLLSICWEHMKKNALKKNDICNWMWYSKFEIEVKNLRTMSINCESLEFSQFDENGFSQFFILCLSIPKYVTLKK